MKYRINRLLVAAIGLHRSVIYSQLVQRANNASLYDGDKRFFFCPVARNANIDSTNDSYRPLTDVLPFYKEQCIRNHIRALEESPYLTVFRTGNRWDRSLRPNGTKQRKRTHRYHIPKDILSEYEKTVTTNGGYLVFDRDVASKYGVVEAIVLNLLEYESAKLRKVRFASEIVDVTVPDLASKIGVSPCTVRRAMRTLAKAQAVKPLGGTSYELLAPVTVKLPDSFKPFVTRTPLQPPTIHRKAPEAAETTTSWKQPIPSHVIPTGIPEVDEKIGGFGRGELTYLVGQTGHGKTISMINFAVGAAYAGQKALMFSLEMSVEDIQARLFSNVLGLDSHKIRMGEIDCTNALAALPPEQQALLNNLRVVGLKRSTTRELTEVVHRLELEGYRPDVILIDQFSYLEPNKKVSEDIHDWKNQKCIANDLTEWAAESLKSNGGYAVCCLHQANGDPMLEYGRESISGCKAVIEPASLVVGLGHNDGEPRRLRLFSLKNRHGNSFQLTLPCNFSLMKIGQSEEGRLALAS